MLNKWLGIGRLTKDPELKTTAQNQTYICKFTIAVNRNKREGQTQDTDFVPCVVFGKRAENLCKYQKKGSLLQVTGRLELTSWEDQENKRHYSTSILVEEINYLGKSGGSNGGNGAANGTGDSESYDDFVSSEEDDNLPF